LGLPKHQSQLILYGMQAANTGAERQSDQQLPTTASLTPSFQLSHPDEKCTGTKDIDREDQYFWALFP
jgi:hypothetical protein